MGPIVSWLIPFLEQQAAVLIGQYLTSDHVKQLEDSILKGIVTELRSIAASTGDQAFVAIVETIAKAFGVP